MPGLPNAASQMMQNAAEAIKFAANQAINPQAQQEIPEGLPDVSLGQMFDWAEEEVSSAASWAGEEISSAASWAGEEISDIIESGSSIVGNAASNIISPILKNNTLFFLAIVGIIVFLLWLL